MSSIACILQCGKSCDEATDSITSIERWENIKRKTMLWQGLDKFGDVHKTVDWDKGPTGHYVHEVCRLNLCTARKLEQVIKRQTTRDVDDSQSQSSFLSDVCSAAVVPPAKRLRSDLGQIHDKTKCVWCCKLESAKHPDTKLIPISYDNAWAAFKSHTVALEDQVMRDRINCLINYAADQPYAIEI